MGYGEDSQGGREALLRTSQPLTPSTTNGRTTESLFFSFFAFSFPTFPLVEATECCGAPWMDA